MCGVSLWNLAMWTKHKSVHAFSSHEGSFLVLDHAEPQDFPPLNSSFFRQTFPEVKTII